jgi:purine-nucleoside phosphorylase
MSTPHNAAKKGDIAKTVLMPGDPLRAKFIAETFLDNPVSFNDVRGMLGYTGTYKGKPVSVMGSGMGMPSMGIYSFELYTTYDVDTIIRVGSCGAFDPAIKLYEVIVVESAYSTSTYAKNAFMFSEEVLYPTKQVNQQLVSAAQQLKYPVLQGRIHSSDVFYFGKDVDMLEIHQNQKVIAAEMEAFALFANAKYCGKQAACLLTVSDNIATREETTPEERQNAFTKMMEIALQSIA